MPSQPYHTDKRSNGSGSSDRSDGRDGSDGGTSDASAHALRENACDASYTASINNDVLGARCARGRLTAFRHAKYLFSPPTRSVPPNLAPPPTFSPPPSPLPPSSPPSLPPRLFLSSRLALSQSA
ncbi:unnamed protein product [Closterium sp. NIES-53]